MRRLVFGIVFVCLAWLVGLVAFVTALPQPTTNAPARSDAVVVYTGGGGARITAGMSLLADGAAGRLLISGVHPDITRENVADFWTGAPELFECCVDLGWQAQSTTGNADEAAQWTMQNDATRIVLVTSDFHMPRALAESRAAMPATSITPHVVSSGYLNGAGRPTSLSAWRRLGGEFNKFLLAKAKTYLASARK